MMGKFGQGTLSHEMTPPLGDILQSAWYDRAGSAHGNDMSITVSTSLTAGVVWCCRNRFLVLGLEGILEPGVAQHVKQVSLLRAYRVQEKLLITECAAPHITPGYRQSNFRTHSHCSPESGTRGAINCAHNIACNRFRWFGQHAATSHVTSGHFATPPQHRKPKIWPNLIVMYVRMSHATLRDAPKRCGMVACSLLTRPGFSCGIA